jgi:hypothetical protein
MTGMVDALERIARRGPTPDPVTPANWARKQVGSAYPDVLEMERIAIKLRTAGYPR